MGDIIASSDKAPEQLANRLANLIKRTNTAFKQDLLSPLTVTLGDEFQGVARDAKAAVSIMLYLEKQWLKNAEIELRYSWVQGQIDTAINPDIAYGMLGPALTHARKMLSSKARDRPKLQVHLDDRPLIAKIIHDTAIGLFGISKTWNPKDFALILDLLSDADIRTVAQTHKRDTSSVYRRRDTLMIEEYAALAQALHGLAALIDGPSP